MCRRTLLAIVLSTLACESPTASRLVERLTFESIYAPAAVAAPGPVSLEIRLIHGACHHDIRIVATRSPGVLQLEALADYRLPPGTHGCIDIGVWKDTTLTYADLSAGSLLVRGLQKHGDPLEVIVLVTAD